MWIRLLTRQQVMDKGQPASRHPGDWVDVGRQTAMLWIAKGWADVPGADRFQSQVVQSGCGVVIVGAAGGNTGAQFTEVFPGLGTVVGAPQLAFEKTLVWTPTAKLRNELIPTGFGLLDTWQLAVPLWNYEQLACHVGSPEDQEKTKVVVHDLRVPLFDTRLIFARREPEVERLFQLWQAEVADGADEKHAFLRSLYKTKPYVLALPVTWVDPNAPR